MVSRKRNKGRARKAAKPPASRHSIPRDNPWLSVREFALARDNGEEKCRHHSAGEALPEGHVCYRFLDAFTNICCNAASQTFAGGNIGSAAEVLRVKFPEIWEDDSNRSIVKAQLARIGTDILLEYPRDKEFAAMVAGAVAASDMMLFAPPIEMMEKEEASKLGLKINDCLTGCEHSVVQWFSRNALCSCLDGRYAAAKRLSKRGKCANCGKQAEHKQMLVCGGCGMEQYCSKECQLVQWPRHKQLCLTARATTEGPSP